jgi:hypothetical protein
MRYLTIGIGFAAALAAGPAFADGASPPAKGEEVLTVAPGDHISIACDAIDNRDANSDVRVVLTISAMPDASAPGFKRVMATDEQLSKDAVRVRVPNMQALDDQTVNLDVYVVDRKGEKSCDAGHVRIAQGYKLKSQPPGGQKS